MRRFWKSINQGLFVGKTSLNILQKDIKSITYDEKKTTQLPEEGRLLKVERADQAERWSKALRVTLPPPCFTWTMRMIFSVWGAELVCCQTWYYVPRSTKMISSGLKRPTKPLTTCLFFCIEPFWPRLRRISCDSLLFVEHPKVAEVVLWTASLTWAVELLHTLTLSLMKEIEDVRSRILVAYII